MLLSRRAALAAAPWRHIQRACIWRGRDDPTGEVSPRMEDVVHVLSGPLDNREPRIVTRDAVDRLVEEQHAELQIERVWEKLKKRGLRMRHERANIKKYKTHYKQIVYPPVYGMAFKDPNRPLTVDIGSGNGFMLLLMAKRNPNMNFLGLEKRTKRVSISQGMAKVMRLKNIHFVLCNATISFETLLATYPGPISMVMIVCPDPHIHKRFMKIRMVRSHLVTQIVKSISPGCKIFLQSEFADVADYIRDYFDVHLGEYLKVVEEDNDDVYDEGGWLLMNPIGIRTEVEIDAVAHGEKVYRRYYERTDKVYAPRIPFWQTLPPSEIEEPDPLPPRSERPLDMLKKRPIGPRRCRMMKRLPMPASDLILNGECYPKSFFKKMLTGPMLKYKYRDKNRLMAMMRPLDPRYAMYARQRTHRAYKKPLGVYEGWKRLYKM